MKKKNKNRRLWKLRWNVLDERHTAKEDGVSCEQKEGKRRNSPFVVFLLPLPLSIASRSRWYNLECVCVLVLCCACYFPSPSSKIKKQMAVKFSFELFLWYVFFFRPYYLVMYPYRILVVIFFQLLSSKCFFGWLVGWWLKMMTTSRPHIWSKWHSSHTLWIFQSLEIDQPGQRHISGGIKIKLLHKPKSRTKSNFKPKPTKKNEFLSDSNFSLICVFFALSISLSLFIPGFVL